MSFVPEALGDGYDFVHQGKIYHLGLITQEVKSKFEKLVFAKEKAKIAEVKELFTPEKWQEKSDALGERYLSGGFSIVQSDMSLSPLAIPENVFALIACMMGVPEAELIGLMSFKAAREELMSLFKLAMKDSFPGISFEDESQKKTP